MKRFANVLHFSMKFKKPMTVSFWCRGDKANVVETNAVSYSQQGNSVGFPIRYDTRFCFTLFVLPATPFFVSPFFKMLNSSSVCLCGTVSFPVVLACASTQQKST